MPAISAENSIPAWVKNTARWWSQGAVGDGDFVKGIQYLVDQNIISVPAQNSTVSGGLSVPVWVKNVAGMWTSGKVSDSDFLKGIGYLVQIGIIHVQPQSPVASQLPTISPQPNATSPGLVQTVPPPNVTLQNRTVSAAPPSPVPAATSANQTGNGSTGSLVGTGVNLKVIGNVASGTLTLSGVTYQAPSLQMTQQGGQIKMQGNVQTSYTSILEVVGLAAGGNQYNFYGSITTNGKFAPVQFTATLTNPPTNQTSSTVQTGATTPLVVTPQTPATTKQAPGLPMLLLYAQTNQVTMGYPYNLAVKVFDPKANPDKTFDQFSGGILGAAINGTILDQNNQKISSFSGLTDRNGLYQYSMLAPYYQGWQQEFKVSLNASKSGYAPQSLNFYFITQYPNQGGSACLSTVPLTPSGFTAVGSNSVSSPQVTLSWTASSGATGYNIFRGTTNGGPYTQAFFTVVTPYTDTTVTHGTTYYYLIQATNCAGKSANSTQSTSTPNP